MVFIFGGEQDEEYQSKEPEPLNVKAPYTFGDTIFTAFIGRFKEEEADGGKGLFTCAEESRPYF